MYKAIIIFAVILLLAIIVVINFADSGVPKLVRFIVSFIIIGILAAGIYFLTAPAPILSSSSIVTTPLKLPDSANESSIAVSRDTGLTGTTDTPKESLPVISKDIVTGETVEDTSYEDTIISLGVKPKDTERTQTDTSTVKSSVTRIPSDTLPTLLAATETLAPNKQIINACTAWIIIANKPAKVTYRNCCTNTDTTITVTGSKGVCAVYGFTPTGAGVTLISNSSCKCK